MTIVATRLSDQRSARPVNSCAGDTTRMDHAAHIGGARQSAAIRNIRLSAALSSQVAPKRAERRRDMAAFNDARIARMLAEQAAILAAKTPATVVAVPPAPKPARRPYIAPQGREAREHVELRAQVVAATMAAEMRLVERSIHDYYAPRYEAKLRLQALLNGALRHGEAA